MVERLSGRTAILVASVAAAAFAGVLAGSDPLLCFAVLGVAVLAVLPIEWLFAAAAAAAVAQGVAIDVGAASVRLDEVIAVVFAVRAFLSRERRAMGAPELALGVFLLVLVVSSLVAAPSPGVSLRSTALIGFGALAYAATATGITRERAIQSALRALLVVVAGGAVIGLIAVVSHAVTGSTWGITLLDRPAGFAAATGIAFEHNLYGSMCAMGALAFLGLWRQAGAWSSSRSALAGFWVCAAGLVASLTRGAWVGFAAGLLVLVMITKPAPGRSLLRLAAAGVGIALAILALLFVTGRGAQIDAAFDAATGAVGEQAGRTLEFGRETGLARVTEWEIATHEVLAADPVFGLGTDSYGQVHLEEGRFGPIPAFLGNWVVRTFHDGGIVALVALATFFLAVAWPSRGLRAADGELAIAVRALIAAAACAAVSYLATDGLYFVWPWLVLGLIRAGRASLQEQGANATSD